MNKDFKKRLIEAEKIMKSYFAKYDFHIKHTIIDNYSFELLFLNAHYDLYIKIKGSSKIYDYPPYINVILGKGDDVYPFSDKNSVALWEIIRNRENDLNAGEYPFEMIYKKDFFERISKDLDKNATSFLLKKDAGIIYNIRN